MFSFPVLIIDVNCGLIVNPGICQTGNAKGTYNKGCNHRTKFSCNLGETVKAPKLYSRQLHSS